MTEQQIDRERLAEWRDQTARIVEKYGNEAWAEIHANEVVAIIDALTAADARIARLTAQAEIRRRAVAIYQQRAVEAEARINAVRDVLDQVEDGHSTDQIVRDLYPHMVTTAKIRRALDGTVTTPPH